MEEMNSSALRQVTRQRRVPAGEYEYPTDQIMVRTGELDAYDATLRETCDHGIRLGHPKPDLRRPHVSDDLGEGACNALRTVAFRHPLNGKPLPPLWIASGAFESIGNEDCRLGIFRP